MLAPSDHLLKYFLIQLVAYTLLLIHCKNMYGFLMFQMDGSLITKFFELGGRASGENL